MFGRPFAVWPIGFLLQQHLARIRLAQSSDDMAERAFAGSVLSDERVDFSGSQIEINILQNRTGICLSQSSSF
jgi:hypothetical protein